MSIVPLKGCLIPLWDCKTLPHKLQCSTPTCNIWVFHSHANWGGNGLQIYSLPARLVAQIHIVRFGLLVCHAYHMHVSLHHSLATAQTVRPHSVCCPTTCATWVFELWPSYDANIHAYVLHVTWAAETWLLAASLECYPGSRMNCPCAVNCPWGSVWSSSCVAASWLLVLHRAHDDVGIAQ